MLTAGLIFSYTRAAWLSLVGAIGVFLIVRLRIPVWTLVVLALSAGGVYWANYEQITIALERNREESSDDLGEHVRSISNISSDASNLERINRWNSAMRMFEERPVFGWGPGTYMFQYAPFQASEDRTIISTNFGEGGNAHSEYLGPMSEQGIPGIGLMLTLVIVTLVTGMRLYARMPPGVDRRLMLAALLGLVTYYLHGALNNFLDTDKASVPFWAFTVIIVHFDMKYPKASRKVLAESA
jgi:O-antigen ligase